MSVTKDRNTFNVNWKKLIIENVDSEITLKGINVDDHAPTQPGGGHNMHPPYTPACQRSPSCVPSPQQCGGEEATLQNRQAGGGGKARAFGTVASSSPLRGASKRESSMQRRPGSRGIACQAVGQGRQGARTPIDTSGEERRVSPRFGINNTGFFLKCPTFAASFSSTAIKAKDLDEMFLLEEMDRIHAYGSSSEIHEINEC